MDVPVTSDVLLSVREGVGGKSGVMSYWLALFHSEMNLTDSNQNVSGPKSLDWAATIQVALAHMIKLAHCN